jgi:hypothetical protein
VLNKISTNDTRALLLEMKPKIKKKIERRDSCGKWREDDQSYESFDTFCPSTKHRNARSCVFGEYFFKKPNWKVMDLNYHLGRLPLHKSVSRNMDAVLPFLQKFLPSLNKEKLEL